MFKLYRWFVAFRKTEAEKELKMTNQVAVIAGIRGTAGFGEKEGYGPPSLPNIEGNCDNCDELIKAIPDSGYELGYYWPETCPRCDRKLVLPGYNKE